MMIDDTVYSSIRCHTMGKHVASNGSSSSAGNDLSTSFVVCVWCMLVIVRSSLGYEPHSGQDNYHGNVAAYGGDYEAQRHWMELTLHLPIGDWYWYDLEYWGLDYPPLTAYVSYVCGVLSSYLVGPESVALYESRGFEDETHKGFMRGTVIVLDLLVYGSAVWIVSRRGRESRDMHSMWTFAMAMSQPALLLIDHAHFQYNSVSLGFALWSFHYMTAFDERRPFASCVIGAFWFCLALNFKQMTLYYAPAVFCYLLGRCCGGDALQFATRFVALAVTVVITFAVQWWPFVWFAPSQIDDTTALERLIHVLRRIFPFQRGLFEGKVSNLWCALSTKPFSIRERIPESALPIIALATTLILVLPTCIKLFQVGRVRSSSKPGRAIAESDWRALLWGTTSTGLAFFLASFQVHEKSILMAIAPASLLIWEDFRFVNWLSLVSTWSLWPLMRVDRVEVGYVCITIMYIVLALLFWEDAETGGQTALLDQRSCFRQIPLAWLVVPLSYATMLVMHFLEIVVDLPPQLPDLFAVFWSILGCGMFCLAWLVSCWHLWLPSRGEEKGVHHKLE